MPFSVRDLLPVVATTLLLACAGCGESSPPRPPSITDLADDPIALSGVLDRCNREPAKATSRECLNARAAFDRREASKQGDRQHQAEQDFERAREQRRARDEREQRAREGAQAPPDAYQLPVAPEH